MGTPSAMWTYSVPAGQLPVDSVAEMVGMCNEAGITAIEGQVQAFEAASSDTELQKWSNALREAGVEVTTFHLPFRNGVDLAALYETDRRRSVDATIKWVEASVKLGCHIGITHPSTNRNNVDVEGEERYHAQLRKSCDELLPTLQRLDYRIAIENMLPGPAGGRFGSRPEHFQTMSEYIDTRHFGFCLDTGHELVSSGTPSGVDALVEAMAPHLIAFHLADNAGDRDSHLAPGRGLVDWVRVFTHAREIGFSGCMCIETPPFAPGPAYTAEAWREHLEQTIDLARRSLEAR